MGHTERTIDVSWPIGGGARWWIGMCNNCHKPVLVYNDGQIVWPNPMPSSTSDHIHEDSRNALIEAKKCSSVQAWNATVAMCRRAIQAACIEKGADPEAKIYRQIDFLRDEGYITKGLHDSATVVRWTGNSGAHPDKVKIDKQHAEEALHLAEEILRLLYEVPARTAAQRASIGK